MARGAKASAAILLVAALWWAWNWNWFKPLVERKASSALGRSVRIAALSLHDWRRPVVILHGIEIDNPSGFPGETRFGGIERLELTLDLDALVESRTLHLARMHLEQPQATLFAPPDAEPNWILPPASPSNAPPALKLAFGELSIAGGEVHLLHPALKSDFRARFDTRPGERSGESELHVEARGRYAGQPIEGRFVGGSLLALRDEQNPYPLMLDVANGPTRLHLQGTLLDPVRLGGAKLALRFEGADLAALYPLTGVPLPPTAPYRIAGQFDYLANAEGPQFRFRDFSGTVGGSDLAGDLAVRVGGPRLKIVGELRSTQVLMADFAGLVGAPPGEADAKGQTAAQKKAHAKRDASPRVLPTTPLNLPKMRAADFDIRYAAQRIESQDTPFDDLSAHLRIDDGVVSLRPISFGVGGGGIAANLRLDATQDLAHVQGDADFRNVDFGALLDAIKYRGSGRVDGRASLDARGNSVAALLGGGNGKLRLSMAGGDVSALLINLAGLDFGNALLSALGIPSRAKLRCMIADLDLKKGLVETDTLLMDTTEANVVGTGTVNLSTEQIDYRVQTQPKTFNIGSVAAPINISGTLKAPKVRPDAKSLGLRGGAAIALGIVATPLAALAATIQPGTGKDVDCGALLKSVRREAASLPRVPIAEPETEKATEKRKEKTEPENKEGPQDGPSSNQ